jgi:hypothetical protein
VGSSAEAVKQYPVLSKSPLYMQQTLIFPYTAGLLFQQAVFQKLGTAGFTEVFRRPPVSSQQIIHPERYFSRTLPAKPALATVQLGAGYKKLMDGTLGELDFQILLRQYLGETAAQELAPEWRGSRYALWENAGEKRAVLAFAVQWATPAAASRFNDLYRQICAKKWKQVRVKEGQPQQTAGTGDDGRFEWTLRGAVFSAVEGLP